MNEIGFPSLSLSLSLFLRCYNDNDDRIIADADVFVVDKSVCLIMVSMMSTVWLVIVKQVC